MIISAKQINTLANSVKTYVEKNKTLPSTVTVNNVKYTYGQVAYILAYAINNFNKSAETFAVKGCSDANGDSINENIVPSDYKDIAKRVASYIKSNKQCPNYATTVKSKKKLRARVFIYMFARIVVWYYNHKKLPNYANANSAYFKTTTTKTATAKKTTTTKSTSNGLHSYLTSQGCQGMGQCTGYYCACNSLQQCFYRLTGILVQESQIASWAGTTTKGTDHNGINTAVECFNKKYNKKVKITWKNFSDLGNTPASRWSALQSYINKGAVFCHLLYRNQYGHYEVPKQVLSDNLYIFNSLGEKCNAPAYCGYVETRSKSNQLSYINGVSQKSIAILTI